MKYTPMPADTSDTELPEGLDELTELLAKNVHDSWAAGRISEGWRYGSQRDDVNKLNPCLVEYEELPETEKSYDRKTAIETLKLIVKLGYKITKEDM